jgi:hypothetical protein
LGFEKLLRSRLRTGSQMQLSSWWPAFDLPQFPSHFRYTTQDNLFRFIPPYPRQCHVIGAEEEEASNNVYRFAETTDETPF